MESVWSSMKSLLLFIKAMSSISSRVYMGSLFATKRNDIAYQVFNLHENQLMDEKAQKTERKPDKTTSTTEQQQHGEDKHDKTDFALNDNQCHRDLTATTAPGATTRPRLPTLHFSYSRRNIFLYALFLLTCNLIIPCILFYPLVSRESCVQTTIQVAYRELTHRTLYSVTKLTPKEVIGISSAALGISSCFDSPMRLYRRTTYHSIPNVLLSTYLLVIRHRKRFGPLGNDTWWYLDFSMWTYTVALLIFAIPLAIAPAVPLL